jgi:hypothetical protein
MQNLIANAQRAEMIRQQNEQLEELKKQNRPQPVTRAEPQERTLKCPACAEWIKAEAKICKHCRTEVGKAFAAIFAEEEAEARAKDLEEKRKAEEAKKRIQKELADEAAATAEREKVRQERIAEQDLAYRAAKAAQREKLKATLKSRKGKMLVAVFAALAISVSFGIVGLNGELNRKNEISIKNEKEACLKFELVLKTLAAPGGDEAMIAPSNKDLALTLSKWKTENGFETTSYQQLSDFSKSIIAAPVKKINEFYSKLDILRQTSMTELISTCNLSEKFIFSDESSYRGNFYGACSNILTKAVLQAKNSGGKWETLTSLTMEKIDLCSTGWYSPIFADLGLLDIVNAPNNLRIRYSSADGSMFMLEDWSENAIKGTSACFDYISKHISGKIDNQGAITFMGDCK